MRSIRTLGFVFASGLLLLVSNVESSSGPALAVSSAEGSLDTTFGTNGKVTTDFGGGTAEANSTIVQPDGKILTVGNSGSGTASDFALARYNTDGTLDTSFDTDGKVTTDFNGLNDYGRPVVVQPNGKILVAGTSFTSLALRQDFAVARYNADGSLDTTFDTDGKVTTDFSNLADNAYAMALQPDGKIVVVGTATLNVRDIAIARYNSDGTLDTSFDADGQITVDVNNVSDEIGRGVAIQTDGKIVILGTITTGSATDFVILRYNSNGTLDTSFDSDGKVITDVSGGKNDYGRAVSILPDGRIVVAGWSDTSPNTAVEVALARYNSDGTLDTSFDTDGMVITDIDGSFEDSRGIAVQPDGKVVISGSRKIGAQSDFLVIRYNSDGTLDTSFDTDGIVTTDFAGLEDTSSGIELQTDGKIIAVGGASASLSFAVVRYNAAPLSATLAATTAASSTSTVSFTVTGTGTVDCATLSKTAGVDFDLSGISAIIDIAQTSPAVCTITATSTATAGGPAVTATLTASSTFSVGFTNANKRTTINNATQSISVSVPLPTTTTASTTTTTIQTIASPTTVAPKHKSSKSKTSHLPATGSDARALLLPGAALIACGILAVNRRRSGSSSRR